MRSLLIVQSEQFLLSHHLKAFHRIRFQMVYDTETVIQKKNNIFIERGLIAIEH